MQLSCPSNFWYFPSGHQAHARSCGHIVDADADDTFVVCKNFPALQLAEHCEALLAPAPMTVCPTAHGLHDAGLHDAVEQQPKQTITPTYGVLLLS
jgi:hypothetical protein